MVSRETLLADGLEQLGLSRDAAGRLEAFAVLLETVAIPRGFMGPAEAPRLAQSHLLDAAALVGLIEARPLVDVGSGAGLPGVVLAILGAGPVTLVEAEAKRASFLTETAATLGLDLTVVCARAEDAGRSDLRDTFAVGTGRALAAPVVAMEYVIPLLAPGGQLVLPVGPSAVGHDDRRRTASVATMLAARLDDVVRLQVPGQGAERWAMIVTKVGLTPERYPRRTGVPAKRPLA